MARKKRKKKWPFVLLTLACLAIVLPVTVWLGVHWFVGAVVKGPDATKPAARSTEKITQEEQRQLNRIIENNKP
jgi:hypothetical protein